MFACSLCCSRGVCLALDSRSTVLKGRYGHWPSIFQGFETHSSFLRPCLCYGAVFRRGCSDQPSSFFPARQGFMTPGPHKVKISRCPNCFKFSWHFCQAINENTNSLKVMVAVYRTLCILNCRLHSLTHCCYSQNLTLMYPPTRGCCRCCRWP